jgi:hypothetical protein
MKNLGALNYAAALNSAARRSKPAGAEIGGAECREQVCPPTDVEVFSLDIPFYRTADQPSLDRHTGKHLLCGSARCAGSVLLCDPWREIGR